MISATRRLIVICTLWLVVGCTSTNDSNASPVSSDPTSGTPGKVIVLAIDGGGIKGVVPATFLQVIEQLTGKRCHQLFDVIGGTSTGGIITTALTSPDVNGKPFTASEIVEIYSKDGSKIFVKQGSGDYDAEYYADKNGKGVETYLRQALGAKTRLTDTHAFTSSLQDNRVKQIFTTAYIVNSSGGKVSNPVRGRDYGPCLFNWFDALKSTSDDYYVWEAARATSAAPTYFPVAHVGGGGALRSTAGERWAMDGGTMSNDPAVWGVTEAFRTGLATRLDEIVVISLGCGLYSANAGVGITNEGITIPSDGNWGSGPWLDDLYNLDEKTHADGTLLSLILDAVQIVSDDQMRALQAGGLQYFRLEPPLDKSQVEMDNISPANIKSLVKTANQYISSGGDGYAIMKGILAALN